MSADCDRPTAAIATIIGENARHGVALGLFSALALGIAPSPFRSAVSAPNGRRFSGLDDFPFVELKVARHFITACAGDRRKQAACRRIIDFADGVENRADFLAARELGFNLAQGVLFAKSMTVKKFARTVLGRDAPWSLVSLR
jgi:hypothetical protein